MKCTTQNRCPNQNLLHHHSLQNIEQAELKQITPIFNITRSESFVIFPSHSLLVLVVTFSFARVVLHGKRNLLAACPR